MRSQNSQPRRGDRLVIGITGHIGAGKTSVGHYLRSVHGFHYTRYSQVLSDWKAQNPESKAHLQAVGWEVMAGGMQAELNARLISQLRPQCDCAVDGLRHPVDCASLDTAFGFHFHLLFISCPSELRFQRLKEKNPKRFVTPDDFRRADSHSVEEQIDSLRERAFAVLKNESSLRALYSHVDAVLKKIRSGGAR